MSFQDKKGEPAERIPWKMREIQHRHMMLVHGAAETYGLHFGQPRILHTVSVMNGATQKEIAEKLQISPASLAMSIKRMQKAGLLRKTADEKDLRVNFIKLTEQGEQVEKICFANLNRADKQMLSGFSPDEIEQLYGYMERMCKNLERIGDTGNVE